MARSNEMRSFVKQEVLKLANSGHIGEAIVDSCVEDVMSALSGADISLAWSLHRVADSARRAFPKQKE